LTAAAIRDTSEQTRSFTVKQIASSDRFLSSPLEGDFTVESGTYSFTVGKEEVSFDFKGGSLREFTEALNRRGRGVVQSSLIAVKPGTQSLLIESKITGEENTLSFAGAAIALGEKSGMINYVYDESAETGTMAALNAVSTAQDAIITMEGIEIRRAGNEIDDLVPGVTLSIKEVSNKPVKLQIETDREAVKDAIITMVGNYNRLMAEINILTRSDTKVIDELTYLTKEEKADYLKRLGSFSGDSTLLQMRNSMMRIVSAPYETSLDRDMALLAQIGIGTDVRRAGGSNASQLRGYLEIDEKVLDAAIASKLPAIKQLFSSDTNGDLLPDTGIAYSLDLLAKPYVEVGGLFALKTNSMDSRIDQENRRIVSLDRQLAAKEAELKKQYGQMESAYNRMEQMSGSFDRFQQQNNNNSR
jgi:flagellar hook-associated protein 2